VLQRILAKAVAVVTKDDVTNVCGTNNLCGGLGSGIESGIHAMKDLWDDEETEIVILVDAANAFNALDRQAALWNSRILWPRASLFLFNTYRGYARIFVRGVKIPVLRREGTTQGDPLAMMMYAVGVLPLVLGLKNTECYIQSWYADDSGCGGKMNPVRIWLDKLMVQGPKFGYYPEPTKSIAIVKDGFLEKAKEKFGDLGIEFVEASKILGGFLGKSDKVRELLTEKVHKWVESVEDLADAAVRYPQDAYTAFIKSLQCEWGYLQRAVESDAQEFEALDKVIQEISLPAVFGWQLRNWEYDIVKLPVNKGGLGIRSPSETCKRTHNISVDGTSVLVESVKSGAKFEVDDHVERLRAVKMAVTNEKYQKDSEQAELIIGNLPKKPRRVLERVVKENSSGWLSMGSSRKEGFDLSAEMFRDRLDIRNGKELKGLPTVCDGCGARLSLEHALNCKKGGNVKYGHDQMREECALLAEMAYGKVVMEPYLKDSTGAMITDKNLRADFMAIGVWERQRVAFFDNCIIDADAPSRFSRNTNSQTAMASAVRAKRRLYNEAWEDVRASITPLVCTADGAFDREFVAFQKRVAARLATKWQRPFSVLINYVRVRLRFALIRAIDLRIRGSRKRIHGTGFMDGAGLGLVF